MIRILVLPIIVVGIFLWWIFKEIRHFNPTFLMWGTVVGIDIDLGGEHISRISIETPQGPSVVLEIDTRDYPFCTHKEGADCWHYRAKELNELIRLGTFISAKIDQKTKLGLHVYAIVAPTMQTKQ